MSLYKAQIREIEDATTVLTDQAGIEDFIPDGSLRLDRSLTEPVWFRYDPSQDRIVQEEVEPSNFRGLFDTAEDVYRFLDWYADQYDITDISYPELYRANLLLEGVGQVYNTNDSERPDAADTELR